MMCFSFSLHPVFVQFRRTFRSTTVERHARRHLTETAANVSRQILENLLVFALQGCRHGNPG
jgi:hypothetical protein